MDQPSDTSNDNPFKPEEEATFDESVPEATVASVSPVAPLQQPAEPEAPQPFAPSPFMAAAPIAPVTPAASATTVTQEASEPASSPSLKTKKFKWIPLAIAGGALVLLGGSASAYYFAVYQNPDNVLFDAYSHFAAATAMQASGSATFDMPVTSGVKLKSIEYSGNFENNPSGTVNITAKMTLQGADVSVGGKGMFTDNGDLYFQLNGLVDSFKLYARAMGGEDQVPASFYTTLGKVQDQWVKVTNDDIKKSSEEAAKGYKCVIDVYKKHKDDGAKTELEAYKKHPFIVKKEDLGTKDGRIGYKLAFDTIKLKEYTVSIKDTELAKDLKACGGSSESDISTMDTSSAGDVTTNVWIDQWSHELKRIEYGGSFGESTSKVTYDGNVDVAYDKNVSTTAPSGTITIDEFGTRFEAVVNELYGASASDDSLTNPL